VSSLPIVRRRWYPLFFTSHVVGFIGFLATVNYHTPYALPWIAYGVVVIYGLDLGLRLCLSSSLAAVTVTPRPDGIAEVWVHYLNAGWHAGQHVQIRLLFQPRVKCSRWSWRTLSSSFRPFESHPYSISAPASLSSSPGFPIYVRSQGEATWSGDVNTLAPGTKLWAVIEGPYGEARDLASEGETCLAICGGSGATWTLAMLRDLVQVPDEALRVRKVVVLWAVKRLAHVHWFLQHWDQLIQDARTRKVDFSVQIHVSEPVSSTSFDTNCEIVSGVGYSPRADLAALLDKTIKDAINPCRQTSECTCGTRSGNDGCCPMDVESCCRPTRVSEDEIIPLSACCQPTQDSSSYVVPDDCCGPKEKACCGKCGWDGATAVQPVPSLIRDRGMVVTVCGPSSMAVSSLRFCAQTSFCRRPPYKARWHRCHSSKVGLSAASTSL
jgi:ferric-chelate reductase